MDSQKKYPENPLSIRTSETVLASPFLGEVFTEAQLPELENLKTPSEMFLQESPFLSVFENTALGLDESETQEFEGFLNDIDDEFEDDYFHAEEDFIDSLDEEADFIDENELEEAYEDSEEGDSQEEDESETSIGNTYEYAVEPDLEEPPFLHYDAEFPEFEAMSASNFELDELELGLVSDDLLETGIHGLSEAETSEADLGTTGDLYLNEDSEFDTEQETPFLPEADAFAEEVWSNPSDQTDFRDRVLAAHITRSRKRHGAPKPNLKTGQLKKVDGTKIFMRRGDAAEAASKMLGAARSALASAQVNGDPDALKTSVLTANSGYRSSKLQRRRWLGLFNKYYNQTRSARESLPGGVHSGQAVTYMLKYISSRIAAPGYSKHQAGIAIDLRQHRSSGPEIKNSTNRAAQKRWRDTWFYTWLEANAERFGFKPKVKKEPFHWVYEPGQISNNPATQDSRGNPMFSLPRQLSEAVRKGLFSLQVALSILSGQRDERKLTNMIFSVRHPELPQGYKISASEKALAREWIDIRNNSVRPVLRKFPGSASTTVPSANTTTSVSSSSTAPRVGRFVPPPRVVGRIDRHDIRNLIERAATAHGMDAHLIRGIIAAESGGNTDAGKGTNGYRGLMQCKQDDDQLNPATSIQCGVKKYKRFERNIKNFFIAHDVDWDRLPVERQIELVMASYNAGPFTLKQAASYAVKGGRSALEWERPEFFQRALLYTGAYSIRVAAKKCGVEKGEDGKRKIAEANGERLRFRNVRFKKHSPAGEMLDPGPTIEEAHERGAPALMICALKFKAQNNSPYRKKILAYRKHFASRS